MAAVQLARYIFAVRTCRLTAVAASVVAAWQVVLGLTGQASWPFTFKVLSLAGLLFVAAKIVAVTKRHDCVTAGLADPDAAARDYLGSRRQ